MRIKIMLCLVFVLFLTTSCAIASEGWIYSTEGAAYYSTAYNFESGKAFTWSGDVLNGRVHGNGIQTFHFNNGPKNASYEGTMVEGYREGHGKFNWVGFVYEGEWLSSNYHGKGLMTTASYQYLGEFVNGKKNGRGVWRGDGFVSVGQFINNKFIESQDLNPGYFIIGMCTHNREEAMQEAEKHRKLGIIQ